MLAGKSAPARRHEIDNIWAFARLYGVVRYFYPSDAVASLDWNRLAVHGVKRVRMSTDATRLETTLKALFEPVGPGIEIGRTLGPPISLGSSGGVLVAWRYLGFGLGATSGPYAAKRTHRRSAMGGIDGFVTLMQTAPAEALRGKAIWKPDQADGCALGPQGLPRSPAPPRRHLRATSSFTSHRRLLVQKPNCSRRPLRPSGTSTWTWVRG
jgi:hypothetical protein